VAVRGVIWSGVIPIASLMNAKSTHPKSAHAPASQQVSSENVRLEDWGWHYRTLLALRDHLRGGAGDRMREPVGAMEPPSVHPEDLVDELYDRDLARALPENRVEALREIDDAILRLSTGVYSVCEATGRRIPKAQLRAKPWRRFVEGVATR
jgi:RNA polymerase-binding transcription factor DksA